MFASLRWQHEIMLTISTDTLPQTCLSYCAFRIAYMETLERIALARQVGNDPFESFGFLTEVPFLTSVPPHLQLDLLANTWAKHVSDKTVDADLIDESVVYAVCETAARIVENDADSIPRFLEGGPLDVDLPVDHFLASELRNLHLNMSNEGDFLLVSQFSDMPPEEADPLKHQFGLEETRLECLFDAMGRWFMSVDFMMNLNGLLNDPEVARSISVIGLRQQPLC